MKKTIPALVCAVLLASCLLQTPEDAERQIQPRTGDKSARVPWLPTLEHQFIDLNTAGFSLALQPGFEFDINDTSITMSDRSGKFIVSLNGKAYLASSYTLESFLNRYIAEMAARGGSFDQGEPYEIIIDGTTGIAIDLQGTFLDLPVAGKAIAVSPGKDFIVFGLAMSNLNVRADEWSRSGSNDFEAILQSIKFRSEVKR